MNVNDKMHDTLIANFFRDIVIYGENDDEIPINPLIYKSPEGDTCLHIAVIRNNLDIVKKLVELNLDINATDDMGCTPLYFADRKGYEDVYNFLISQGAILQPIKK